MATLQRTSPPQPAKPAAGSDKEKRHSRGKRPQPRQGDPTPHVVLVGAEGEGGEGGGGGGAARKAQGGVHRSISPESGGSGGLFPTGPGRTASGRLLSAAGSTFRSNRSASLVPVSALHEFVVNNDVAGLRTALASGVFLEDFAQVRQQSAESNGARGGGLSDAERRRVRGGSMVEASLNARDMRGRTALAVAVATQAPIDIVLLLLQRKGVDVHARDAKQRAPLHIAARSRYGEAVGALLRAGADVTLVDYKDRMALQMDPRHIQEGVCHIVGVTRKRGWWGFMKPVVQAIHSKSEAITYSIGAIEEELKANSVILQGQAKRTAMSNAKIANSRRHRASHESIRREENGNGPSNGPINGSSNGPGNGPSNGPINGPSNGPSNGPIDTPINGPNDNDNAELGNNDLRQGEDGDNSKVAKTQILQAMAEKDEEREKAVPLTTPSRRPSNVRKRMSVITKRLSKVATRGIGKLRESHQSRRENKVKQKLKENKKREVLMQLFDSRMDDSNMFVYSGMELKGFLVDAIVRGLKLKQAIRHSEISWMTHKVGGHDFLEALLPSKEALLLKPLQSKGRGLREVAFFEAVASGNLDSRLANWIPRYYGVVQVGMFLWIVMEKIAADFQQACSLDLKMGKATFAPNASKEKQRAEFEKFPLQERLGFRVTGMFVFPDRLLDQSYGRTLTLNTVHTAFHAFFNPDVFKGGKADCLEVVDSALEQLEELGSWVGEVEDACSLIASSLLITYDPVDRLVDVRMIDFGNTRLGMGPEWNNRFAMGVGRLLDIVGGVRRALSS